MKNLTQFIIDYIQHLSLYHLMFNVLCLLFLLVSWLLLSELLRQYVSMKSGCNFANLGEFIDGVFAVYGPHIIIAMWVLYYTILIIYNSGQVIAEVITNTLGGISINVWEHELLYMWSVIPLNMEWENVNNIDHRIGSVDIKENTMCIIEKAAKMVRNNVVSAPLREAQAHYNSNWSMIRDLVELKTKNLNLKIKMDVADIDFIKKPDLAQCNQILADKINFHEFIKVNPQYRHKELMYLPNPHGKYNGIPDGLMYDKNNDTFSLIQYKFNKGNSFKDFAHPYFVSKYNNTTHLVSITLAHGENAKILLEIMQQQSSKFDWWLQTHNLNLDHSSLEEIDKLYSQFMQEQGHKIIQDFIGDFENKDYTKFKYDRKCMLEFHEFKKNTLIVNGLGEDHVAQWIPGVKSNE